MGNVSENSIENNQSRRRQKKKKKTMLIKRREVIIMHSDLKCDLIAKRQTDLTTAFLFALDL